MLAGDIEARNVLVEHNLRLVAHIAKKYYTQSDEQDDLISIGTIGLIKGVSSYRPEKGTRLATYAAKCVENEILMYFRSRKKLQGEVSLNDSLDSDADGESLYLMDVVGVEDVVVIEALDLGLVVFAGRRRGHDVFGHSGPRRLPARAKARA